MNLDQIREIEAWWNGQPWYTRFWFLWTRYYWPALAPAVKLGLCFAMLILWALTTIAGWYLMMHGAL